jgi:hypothetical protein
MQEKEYVEALRLQGIDAAPDLLIGAGVWDVAKG